VRSWALPETSRCTAISTGTAAPRCVFSPHCMAGPLWADIINGRDRRADRSRLKWMLRPCAKISAAPCFMLGLRCRGQISLCSVVGRDSIMMSAHWRPRRRPFDLELLGLRPLATPADPWRSATATSLTRNPRQVARMGWPWAAIADDEPTFLPLIRFRSGVPPPDRSKRAWSSPLLGSRSQPSSADASSVQLGGAQLVILCGVRASRRAR